MGDVSFGEVRQRRRRLHAALVELEEAIAMPSGRPLLWREAVAASLERFASTLEDHIHGTECSNGLFQQVVEDAPRLEAHVARLRDEHERLRALSGGLLADLRGAAPGDSDVAALRSRVMDLLALGVRHRQRGADLLYEAYEVDLAAGD